MTHILSQLDLFFFFSDAFIDSDIRLPMFTKYELSTFEVSCFVTYVMSFSQILLIIFFWLILFGRIILFICFQVLLQSDVINNVMLSTMLCYQQCYVIMWWCYQHCDVISNIINMMLLAMWYYQQCDVISHVMLLSLKKINRSNWLNIWVNCLSLN